VEVAPVDQGDPDVLLAQAVDDPQAAEAAADDHDTM
jgi:hypothetical protein